MKILYVLDSPYAWAGGCWFHRNHTPATALKSRGHAIQFSIIDPNFPQALIEQADVIVFSRTYGIDPLPLMRRAKQAGKKVVYEIDDDLWSVNQDNPSAAISTEKRYQYENFMAEVHAITTTTEVLAKKIRKFNKNVHICPNAIDYEHYQERPKKNDILQVGYSGAASHWADLQIIMPALKELQGKYKFKFVLQGMVSSPLESEMYGQQQIFSLKLQPEKNRYMESALKLYNEMRALDYYHIPFYYPYLHAAVLGRCDMDIGLAPLVDNEFNHGKSSLKFYEYAATGTVTLASDVLPYKTEAGYLAKNNDKDWKDKLEKLIADENFRKQLLEKQQKWVKENRDIKEVSKLWEKAFDNKDVK